MEPNKNIYDYEIIKNIGEGAFGKVYKAKRNSDNKIIALKVIDIPVGKDDLVDLSKKEIKYLKTLSFPECNPFVICYYDSYYDSKSRQFLIEMEYIEGEDMFDFINESMDKNEPELHYYLLLLIAKDIAKGLKYMHSKNILHNDIKLENIMIDTTYTPRIIDFGLACHTSFEEHLGKYCKSGGGTPSYISPEYFSLNMRTPAGDMWALGILLYIATMGKYPYDSTDTQDMFEEIINNKAPKINTPNEQLNDVVNGLLTKDLTKRYDADDILRKLDFIPKPRIHPFIPKVSSDDETDESLSISDSMSKNYGFITKSRFSSKDSFPVSNKNTSNSKISRNLTPIEKSLLFNFTLT